MFETDTCKIAFYTFQTRSFWSFLPSLQRFIETSFSSHLILCKINCAQESGQSFSLSLDFKVTHKSDVLFLYCTCRAVWSHAKSSVDCNHNLYTSLDFFQTLYVQFIPPRQTIGCILIEPGVALLCKNSCTFRPNFFHSIFCLQHSV